MLVVLLIGSLVVGGIQIFKTPSKEMPRPSGFKSPWRISKEDVIGIVYIYGEIHPGGDSSLRDTGGADSLVRQLQDFGEEENVKAVILRINSPGGSVGASQEVYEAVKKLRDKGIKVVASIADVGASGAYYIACGADKIVVNPGSLVGSIGVIMSIPDLSGLTKNILQVDFNTIKSGKFKDIASPFRKMEPDERDTLQSIVNDCYQQFVEAVIEGRKHAVPDYDFSETWIDTHLNGLIFSGKQAVDIKLVDELGTFDDAKKIARELAGLGEDVQYISEPRTFLEKLAKELGGEAKGIGILGEKVNDLQQVRLEYMFRPEL